MALITEEEFNMIVKNRDKQIEELTRNLSEAHETIYEMTKEFEDLKRQQLDNEASRAADHEYYIHVPVEEECLSCPRLELETHKAADVMMHKCKHLEFCQSIRSNWEEVKNKKCVDISAQNSSILNAVKASGAIERESKIKSVWI